MFLLQIVGFRIFKIRTHPVTRQCLRTLIKLLMTHHLALLYINTINVIELTLYHNHIMTYAYLNRLVQIAFDRR